MRRPQPAPMPCGAPESMRTRRGPRAGPVVPSGRARRGGRGGRNGRTAIGPPGVCSRNVAGRRTIRESFAAARQTEMDRPACIVVVGSCLRGGAHIGYSGSASEGGGCGLRQARGKARRAGPSSVCHFAADIGAMAMLSGQMTDAKRRTVFVGAGIVLPPCLLFPGHSAHLNHGRATLGWI